MTILNWHVREERIGGREVTRHVENHAHYFENSLWHPSDPRIEQHVDPPAAWRGRWDFCRASSRSSLQTFFGDTSDKGNGAMWGFRLAHAPEYWCNLKLHNATARGTGRVTSGRLAWADVFEQTDLELVPGRAGVVRALRLKGPGHPSEFLFTVSLNPSHSFSVTDGMFRVFDRNGTEWLKSSPASAVDADGEAVGAALSMGPMVSVGPRQRPSVRLSVTVPPEAAYPVEVR